MLWISVACVCFSWKLEVACIYSAMVAITESQGDCMKELFISFQ